jgi:hypothetical protein
MQRVEIQLVHIKITLVRVIITLVCMKNTLYVLKSHSACGNRILLVEITLERVEITRVFCKLSVSYQDIKKSPRKRVIFLLNPIAKFLINI